MKDIRDSDLQEAMNSIQGNCPKKMLNMVGYILFKLRKKRYADLKAFIKENPQYSRVIVKRLAEEDERPFYTIGYQQEIGLIKSIRDDIPLIEFASRNPCWQKVYNFEYLLDGERFKPYLFIFIMYNSKVIYLMKRNTAITLPKISTSGRMNGSIVSFSGCRRITPSSL